MIVLVSGLLLFIATHSVRLFANDWRTASIARLGTRNWRLLYGLVAIASLLLVIYGYGLSRQAPVFLWNPPLWTRHLAILLVWIAFVLFASASVRGNHIKQQLGHPMYAGIKVWAFAHLLANGRLGDVVLFGSLLLWAVLGFTVSRRRDRAQGVSYPAGSTKRTLEAIVGGTVLWAIFLFWLHRLLIGVPPL